jgi:alpha-L-fucosidase
MKHFFWLFWTSLLTVWLTASSGTGIALTSSALTNFGSSPIQPPVMRLVQAEPPEPTLTLEDAQARFLSYKYGMFLHFNMSTFARQDFIGVSEEHEQGFEDPNLFNPTEFDATQWARTAKAAGMKYMVLTTKHHGGFALWDSAVSTHDVASSAWRDSQGDLVREFVDAARAEDLRVGFYYSIWDKTNGNDIDFIKAQLTELLTNYGPIDYLWFDGWDWSVGYEQVPYDVIRDHIKSLQPNCLILENNHSRSLYNTEIVGYEQNLDGLPPADNVLPAELAGNIRAPEANGESVWFYHPEGNCNLKSVEVLASELAVANAGNANFLLDVTPDDRGLIPQCQVDRLLELAATLNNAPPELTSSSVLMIESGDF